MPRPQFTREQAVAAGRVGGRTRGEQLRRRRLELWRERFPGVPAVAARAIYLAGYTAGRQAKHQAQKRRRKAMTS